MKRLLLAPLVLALAPVQAEIDLREYEIKRQQLSRENLVILDKCDYKKHREYCLLFGEDYLDTRSIKITNDYVHVFNTRTYRDPNYHALRDGFIPGYSDRPQSAWYSKIQKQGIDCITLEFVSKAPEYKT